MKRCTVSLAILLCLVAGPTPFAFAQGGVRLEFRAELLNAFNTPCFEASTGNVNGPEGLDNTDYRETPLYNSRDQFRLDGLNGTETSRVVQLISRISW